MNNKIKVAIFGGGIGGLTVAHELSKDNDFDITLYESNHEVGGLARSNRDESGCATEYCWRVFFGFYYNLFSLLSEIENIQVGKDFVEYKAAIFDNKMSGLDILKNAYNIAYGLTSSDDRLNKLDELTWWNSLHGSSKTSVLRQVGPWLGMDRYKASYKSVIKVGMEMQYGQTILKHAKNYVTTLPTSETWFDPWVQQLTHKVKINLSNKVVRFDNDDNKITAAYVDDGKTIKKIDADYYIAALPVQVMAKLFKDVDSELKRWYFDKFDILTKTCLHLQVAFQIYFNKRISFGKKVNSIILVDTPWDLIILNYDYEINGCNNKLCYLLEDVKSGWSVAVCTAYQNGKLIQKPFYKCTPEEIKIELWYQLTSSDQFKDLIIKENGFELKHEYIAHWAPLWKSFYYDENGNLTTTEPKFTNNAGSSKHRPSFKTPFCNLFVSTAYIQETIDIFSMEAACIAGKKVANEINNNKNQNNLILERPLIFKPFREIDNYMYNLYLPNIGPFLLLIIVILVFAVIFNIIFKKST